MRVGRWPACITSLGGRITQWAKGSLKAYCATDWQWSSWRGRFGRPSCRCRGTYWRNPIHWHCGALRFSVETPEAAAGGFGMAVPSPSTRHRKRMLATDRALERCDRIDDRVRLDSRCRETPYRNGALYPGTPSDGDGVPVSGMFLSPYAPGADRPFSLDPRRFWRDRPKNKDGQPRGVGTVADSARRVCSLHQLAFGSTVPSRKNGLWQEAAGHVPGSGSRASKKQRFCQRRLFLCVGSGCRYGMSAGPFL